jgi:quercetin dioxygenase-like cupin family protein
MDTDTGTTSPSTILCKHRDEPDQSLPFTHGRMKLFQFGDEEAWRSELEPGWSFDEDLEPYAEGATSCPYTHREYIETGRIRYLMDDGTELEAGAGDLLLIPPGHRAWVVGDEPCVLIDW